MAMSVTTKVMSKFIVYWSSRILRMSCFSPPLLGKNIYTGYTEVSKLCNRKLKDNPQVFFSLYWKQGKTSFLFLSGHKLLVIKFCASNKVLLRDILLCPGFHKNIVCGVKSLLYKNNALREYSILFDKLTFRQPSSDWKSDFIYPFNLNKVKIFFDGLNILKKFPNFFEVTE